MLTTDQKIETMKGICPYCSNGKVYYKRETTWFREIQWSVACSKCNKKWVEVYELIDIKEEG